MAHAGTANVAVSFMATEPFNYFVLDIDEYYNDQEIDSRLWCYLSISRVISNFGHKPCLLVRRVQRLGGLSDEFSSIIEIQLSNLNAWMADRLKDIIKCTETRDGAGCSGHCTSTNRSCHILSNLSSCRRRSKVSPSV